MPNIYIDFSICLNELTLLTGNVTLSSEDVSLISITWNLKPLTDALYLIMFSQTSKQGMEMYADKGYFSFVPGFIVKYPVENSFSAV